MIVAPHAGIDRLSPTHRPHRAAAGSQRWSDLLFLHWRISPAEATAAIPDWLSVDMCDGSAWLGLVLFRMSGVRPWWSPAIPGVSAFPETNVRTYVHFQGKDPGVLFLSLDAASSLGVRIGRSRWGLPYHRSKMSVRRRGRQIAYRAERLWPGHLGVGGLVEAEIGEPFAGLDRHVEAGRAIPGSLEHFLIERYFMYVQKDDRFLQGRVHHASYPLHEARLTFCDQSFIKDLGLQLDRPPDHAVFSPGVSTEIFPLKPVIAGG